MMRKLTNHGDTEGLEAKVTARVFVIFTARTDDHRKRSPSPAVGERERSEVIVVVAPSATLGYSHLITNLFPTALKANAKVTA